MGGEHWQRSGEELLRALAGHEERMRREYAASLELLAELTTRDVAAEVGYSSLAAVLRDVLRISPAEARRRLSHATAVTEVPMISGGVTPAPLPATAAALREGALGPDHLDVITKVMREVQLHVPDADREVAERTLVDAAHSMDARTLTKVGHRVRAWLNEDGTPPDDRELAEPFNELHLHTRANGRLVLRGEFDPESSALITTVLSPLAKPRPSSDAGPDPRTAAERNGDALVELVHLAATTGELPSEAGERPHLLVTVPLQALRDDVGHATLDGIGSIDAASARRIACDAKIIPAVLGGRSEPLDLGRAAYTVPIALRRALILRDGGPTQLDNVVLLCGRHHRLIHHSPWECAIEDGHPQFRPPAFVDPTRAPRHNSLRATAIA
jgi:hypothetical protein